MEPIEMEYPGVRYEIDSETIRNNKHEEKKWEKWRRNKLEQNGEEENKKEEDKE